MDIIKMQDIYAELDVRLFNILYPIWEERYGKKKVNLNASAEDFFNNRIHRKYEHDSIHESVAYYDSPLFNRILKDNEEVAVDRNKFLALSYEDKLKLVREEIYATALERQLIPSDYKMHYMAGYHWALEKMVTSFSKGWFALFVAENLNELKSPDINFKKKHLDNKDKLRKLNED